MCALCCQVSQRNKENGCHCGKDELQSQFPYTINKITVTHTIYQYENIGRHHNTHTDVYGDAVAKNAEQVLESWEQIKLKEKDGNKTVLSGVPSALPSLIKAYRIQDKARNVGFDWADKQDVWAKVHEELEELEAELRCEDKQRSTEELGDFLFSVINAARLYKLNPDNALEMTNQKFIRRFNYIEQHSIRIGKPLTSMSLEEMDKLWNEAKEKE